MATRPKQPAGPAMTLGNMSDLGVQRFERGQSANPEAP
jgi:hypothetical protein